ncbi:MAG: response regulator transcription factor [Sphaerochaetaceae bacterium]|nr:response regulator transcription factor [Sphaerochaetaceae bacterium]MDC7237850.1 response regulator transcription factor [Sphaerochaetaceae bacterium]
MRAKVLIIEDEIELAQLESLYLNKEGIETKHVIYAEEGLALLKENTFDLVLLDINLPGIDGFEFLTKFRQISQTPVIIVSAREADEDIIMGLGIGADEFVIKPFAPKVLVARVRAIIRRENAKNQENNVSSIKFDDFELIDDSYCLKKAGSIISIPIKEFEILSFLVKNAGKTYSTQEIYDKIWEQEYGDISAVTVYIQRLRKKIEQDYHEPRYIKTVRGKGYYFEKERLDEKKQN